MAELSIEKTWVIHTPNQVDAVFEFLHTLNTTDLNLEQHPFFSNQIQSVPINAQKMMEYHTPLIMMLLSTNVNSLNKVQNSDLIQLIVEIRNSFLCYIRHFQETGPLHTTKEFLDFCKIVYLFRVFLLNGTYGLVNLKNAIIKKLLELMFKHGIFGLFLIFCEFCPDMVCNKYYPVCKTSDVSVQMAFINQDPLYSSLKQKHQKKWDLFLMPQNVVFKSS